MSEKTYHGIIVEDIEDGNQCTHLYGVDERNIYSDKLAELCVLEVGNTSFWGTKERTNNELFEIVGAKNE